MRQRLVAGETDSLIDLMVNFARSDIIIDVVQIW